MGFMDAFLNVMKLNDENEEEIYDDDDYLDDEDIKEAKPAKGIINKNELSSEFKDSATSVMNLCACSIHSL